MDYRKLFVSLFKLAQNVSSLGDDPESPPDKEPYVQEIVLKTPIIMSTCSAGTIFYWTS